VRQELIGLGYLLRGMLWMVLSQPCLVLVVSIDELEYLSYAELWCCRDSSVVAPGLFRENGPCISFELPRILGQSLSQPQFLSACDNYICTPH
jgi:hypothetical protein